MNVLADINFIQGGANPSGIGTIIYFAQKKDIATFPTIDDPLDADATLESVAVLQGDFVMVATKVFNRLYSTFGKGKITSENIGEADCKAFMNKGTFSYPKLNKELLGFSKVACNSDLIYIVIHDGTAYMIGDAVYPSVTTVAGDSGDAAGSAKGGTLSVECPSETSLPIYVGSIELADGTFDCETMVFTPKAP